MFHHSSWTTKDLMLLQQYGATLSRSLSLSRSVSLSLYLSSFLSVSLSFSRISRFSVSHFLTYLLCLAKRLQCRWGIPQVIACASDADWVTKEEHSYLLGLTIFHRGKSLGFQICDGRGPYRVNLKLHLRIPSCPGNFEARLFTLLMFLSNTLPYNRQSPCDSFHLGILQR